MPSVLIGGQSGGQLLMSGNPWSGKPSAGVALPQGGIQFRAWPGVSGQLSGFTYIGLSGGVTITSGTLAASGGANSGLLDGVPLTPGDSYWLPRLATGTFSGSPVTSGAGSGMAIVNVWVTCDPSASGQNRLWFEIF